MKNLLENLVRDYQTIHGYFCRLNIPYRVGKGNPPDIDVLAVNIEKQDVIVCECKSWYKGIQSKYFKRCFKQKNKKTENCFKPLSLPKNKKALEEKVKEITGKKKFRYIIYCLKITSKDKKEIYDFLDKENFIIGGNKIEIVDFKEIFDEVKKHWEKNYRAKNYNSEPETEFEQFIRYLEATK